MFLEARVRNTWWNGNSNERHGERDIVVFWMVDIFKCHDSDPSRAIVSRTVNMNIAQSTTAHFQRLRTPAHAKSYRPFPEFSERLARQYRRERPRSCALVKESSPSFGSPNIYALTQNTLKITVGLGVCVLSVSCWCVWWWCVLVCVCGVCWCTRAFWRHTRTRLHTEAF